MSIRRRIEDAYFLHSNGHTEGALLSVCAAISATSRKRYSDRKAMRDGEAFAKFMDEEMRVVFRGALCHYHTRCPGADRDKYPDELMPFQDVLYQFVRCMLAHEGRIGENVEFTDQPGICIQITDDRVILSGEILRGLLRVPQYAPENSEEFPEIAAMPKDVVGWNLFDSRRDHHAAYLDARQVRLESICAELATQAMREGKLPAAMCYRAGGPPHQPQQGVTS